MEKELKKTQLSDQSESLLADLLRKAVDEITDSGRYKAFGSDGEPLQIIADSIGVKKHSLSKSKNVKNPVSPRETFRRDTLTALADKYRIKLFANGGIEFQDTKDDSTLRRLAGKLALNLVDVSTKIGDKLPYSNILAKKNLWLEREDTNIIPRERYVVITGAGASNAATPRSKPMPSSLDAIKKIKKAYKGDVLQDLIQEKIEDLSESFEDAENPSFELQMRALASFSPEIAIRELRKICGLKHSPSLVYEVLAHFLKHRFVDAIINFNYDELLDNAIQEELPNPGDFQFIYTAGHCQQKLKDLYIDNRIKHPIYIKCHGTISHPNSMRFTEQNAFTIEQAIQRHITDLFLAEVPEAPEHEQQELPLNLLVFGFGMDNRVFNQIIQKVNAQKQENVTFWIFDRDPASIRDKINEITGTRLSKRQNINIELVELEHHGSMKTTLKQLWKETCSCFLSPYKPKSIARHELVSQIFANTSPLDFINFKSQDQENELNIKKAKDYYRDRLLTELGILLLQSDGIVHLRQISGSRAGKMFVEFNKYGNKSIHDFLKLMNLKVHKGFMDDTYVTRNDSDRSSTDKLVSFVLERWKEKFTQARKSAVINSHNRERFRALARGVRKRRLGMVSPKYVNIHDNLFSRIEEEDVMNTSLAWIYNYRRLIDQHPEKWDLMLAITERGSFLNDDLAKEVFKDKAFELVLATSDINREMKEDTADINQLNLLSGSPQFRPWWFHNKHMVLFLKRKPLPYSGNYLDDWDLVEGYFYTHRLLSKRYNPVRIRAHKDLRRLLNIFAIYWDGAISYGESKGQDNPAMRITGSKKSRDAVLKQLFSLYETMINDK